MGGVFERSWMPILVTGGTGFVGNNVIRLLLERGHQVRALVRSTTPQPAFEGLNVELVEGDICDAESVSLACEGTEAVIHVAAMVKIGWSQLVRQRQVNVGGTVNVAKAAHDKDIRMVYVSSVDALGIGTAEQPANEETPKIGKTPCSYVVSKTEAEAALQEVIHDGLDAVIVNPGFMLGPFDWKPSSGKMLVEVINKQPLIAPSGGMTLCHILDVADGILAALERGEAGRNYILGGTTISYFDAWCLFAEVAGTRPPKRKMGPAIRAIAGFVGDIFGKISRREPDINSAAIKMGSLFHYYDSTRAIDELGYSITDSRKTIEDAWTWFQEHGYLKD